MRRRSAFRTLRTMTGEASAARACYEDRLEARRAAVTERGSRASQLANARLAVFALGVALATLGFQNGSYMWGAGAAVVLFLGLVLAHDSAKRQLLRAERAADWYQRALDRLDYRFAGRGHSGDRFPIRSIPTRRTWTCSDGGRSSSS